MLFRSVNRNPINSLFFIAMLLNAVIGIIQELKAKAVLDKLAIVTKPRVKVVRDSQTKELDAGEIVQDDLITVERGDQIVVDGEVIQSACDACRRADRRSLKQAPVPNASRWRPS